MMKGLLVIVSAMSLLAVTLTAREPMSPPSHRPLDLIAVKQQWAEHMQGFHETGDVRPVQRYAREILEQRLAVRGGFQKHFSKGFALDATKGNIGKVIRLAAASSNANQRIGYMREVKYLNEIELDGRFRIASNSDLVNRGGRRLEFDATLRHNETGQLLRMEIKEVKVSASNLGELKEQIARLGAEAKRSGTRQIWVNRKGIPSAYRQAFIAYAEKHGVAVYDRVSTGPKTVATGRARSLQSVLTEEARIVARRGAKQMTRQIAGTVSRWAGRIGVAASVGVFGYSAWQWRTGAISTQEFAAQTVGAASGAVGAWAGAEAGALAGAAIGSIIPGVGTVVGGVIGGVLGGFGGGYLGNWAGESAVNRIAQRPPPPQVFANDVRGLDHAQSVKYFNFLRANYATH